jgi:hypothetical protein
MAKKQQKTALQKVEAWHKTKHGYLLFGVAELLLAYGFISWAIDSGQLWQYVISIVLFIGAIRNFFRMMQKVLLNK